MDQKEKAGVRMYIKVNEFWMFCGVKSLQNINATQLMALVKLTSNEIDEYCNTRFEPTKDNYSADLCERLYTRQQPLLKVNSLSCNGRRLKENKDFYVYTESSKIELNGIQAEGKYKKALSISYTYGYDETPATVKQVIVDLIKLDIESKNEPVLGLQSESWDTEHTYTRQSSKDFTPAELRKNILARLDIFKVEPYMEPKGGRVVNARLL